VFGGIKNESFFNVIREPAFAEVNGEKVYTGKDVLINEENNSVLGVVSPNYKLVTHNEIAEISEEAFSDINHTVIDHLNGQENKWVREIIIEDDEYSFDIDQDHLKAKVCFYNGYNGKTSAGMELSAWRQVCSNGLMGWGKIYGVNLPHMTDNITDIIRNKFSDNFENFREIFSTWDEWSKITYTEKMFHDFLDVRVKNKKHYLSEKQGEFIKELYPVIMNRYNERETKWGTYNVLTAISTHHTTARKGSNIFGNAYNRIARLTSEFFNE
jgi:hypothetical protein